MALTMTRTETFARFDLLELQIRIMLREASDIDAQDLDRISLGLKDPHYIEMIVVQGLFPHGTIGAELRLAIDWRMHKLEMRSGGEMVQVPPSWTNGVAPSIEEGVRTFLSACRQAGLQREWSVFYSAGFDFQSVNRYLGFTPSTHRVWERDPQSANLGLGPLGEGSLVVRLAV
jgi:hypothetical protein